MTTLEIELPDTTARAAREAGLLTSAALDRLLGDALRRRAAADRLLSVANRVAATGATAMPMAEIAAETRAARVARRDASGR